MITKIHPPHQIESFAGFNFIAMRILSYWEELVVKIKQPKDFFPAVKNLNRHLNTGNAIIFFDHHYAFDALPLGLALGKYVKEPCGVLIPYAIHLDMGVGRDGKFSSHYWFRTKLFQWFISNIRRGNPEVDFLPVAREFEMENARLRAIVEGKFSGINTKYLRTLIRFFNLRTAGQVCFITPFSGIAFPGKPVLHPQLYRSIRLALSKTENDIKYFLSGAYPNWKAYSNYYAPLLSRHNIVMKGPFSIPINDYQAAKSLLKMKLQELRDSANYEPPDYDRLLTK
jgi:hypothetical protein